MSWQPSSARQARQDSRTGSGDESEAASSVPSGMDTVGQGATRELTTYNSRRGQGSSSYGQPPDVFDGAESRQLTDGAARYAGYVSSGYGDSRALQAQGRRTWDAGTERPVFDQGGPYDVTYGQSGHPSNYRYNSTAYGNGNSQEYYGDVTEYHDRSSRVSGRGGAGVSSADVRALKEVEQANRDARNMHRLQRRPTRSTRPIPQSSHTYDQTHGPQVGMNRMRTYVQYPACDGSQEEGPVDYASEKMDPRDR
jgi:hypothetical protein